jgi:hypothetical protein
MQVLQKFLKSYPSGDVRGIFIQPFFLGKLGTEGGIAGRMQSGERGNIPEEPCPLNQ